MNIYGLLADLTVIVHVGYVAYVVVGQLLIVAGLIFGWRWVREFWFRATHLLAIGFVAFEEFVGMVCPLTTWEQQLRQLAGQEFSGDTFLSRMMHSLIFIDDRPPEFFTALHIGFAVLVLVTFVLAPPRWPWSKRPARSTPDGTAAGG